MLDLDIKEIYQQYYASLSKEEKKRLTQFKNYLGSDVSRESMVFALAILLTGGSSFIIRRT